MPKIFIIIICIFLFPGCARDSELSRNLKAMRQDYLSGKMSEETYLKRAQQLKGAPDWQGYRKKEDLEEQRRLERERFYRQYQSFYSNPVEKGGPDTNCFRNLDGGITCQKNIN